MNMTVFYCPVTDACLYFGRLGGVGWGTHGRVGLRSLVNGGEQRFLLLMQLLQLLQLLGQHGRRVGEGAVRYRFAHAQLRVE